jgi:perosamine synthetase
VTPTSSTGSSIEPTPRDEQQPDPAEPARHHRRGGAEVVEFERLIARRVRRTHAIAVSSGTAGLHIALAALGVGPGDEVITPAFSFVASANCALYVGAKPVFVDCDPRSLNMRPEDVEACITERTKAIVGVEVFGNPAYMPQLAALSTKHEIPLVEDACEGLGCRIGNDRVGGFGRVAVFGFYANKQITSAEGGMIVTDDDKLAELCRSLRNHGRPAATMEPGSTLGAVFAHERMGWNLRLSELHAALGAAQMRRLDDLIEARALVAERYTRRLLGHPDLILPTVEPDVVPSWFVYVVRLTDRFIQDDRDEIITGLRRHDVGAGAYFPAIPGLPFYRQLGYDPDDYPVAQSVSQRTIALPFFTRLTDREVDLVCQTLELMIRRATFTRA